VTATVCSEWAVWEPSAERAGMSPETLRKIEAGRLPAPAFGTVVCLSQALHVPLGDLADVWLADMPIRQAS
jgi:transcriptional regulator with XRE-family HTH domain